ncbi:hypothetical protein RGQ13_01665 [Thalassotalea psychrophila]|uniref:Uncharacterized protein n=1 Tax=Thalassotalea psychrophila TaxID=3065647 RepID=A0ABY9TVX3_9GAMM|nr:hypothetical protein RGQ13_01665 [Colwelliaceae bacterium SQ149]
MKSLEDIASYCGAPAFSLWLSNNQYYQNNLNFYVDAANINSQVKACLLNFESNSHLIHENFDGMVLTHGRLSNIHKEGLRIIVEADFWGCFLDFLAETRTSFFVKHFYRDETSYEDGSILNQKSFEYIAWKAVPKQSLGTNTIKLDEKTLIAFKSDLSKKEPKRRLKVLKELRQIEFNRINNRKNCGKLGSFLIKIAMIDLCIEQKKSPSDIKFTRYAKRVIKLILEIEKYHKYGYFEIDKSGDGITYTGDGDSIDLSEREIQTKITSLQKRSNLRALINDFYKKILA